MASHLYRVEDGQFTEFHQKPFQVENEEKLLEDWLEKNPNDILEDGDLCIIGRQVRTNLGGFIDLLAVDRQGDIAVIELKRDRTPRDTLAQALEYASYAETRQIENLDGILANYLGLETASLINYHHDYFNLGSNETVAFNKEQRLVIVGQNISKEIKQTAIFLRVKGITVDCLEFTFFQAEDGKTLISTDHVVGSEPLGKTPQSSGSKPKVTRTDFLASLNDFGKPVYEHLLKFAEDNNLFINWGTKGFSMNTDFGSFHVPICYGYPPDAYNQAIVTAFAGQGGILQKIELDEKGLDYLKECVMSSGLQFLPSGKSDFKFPVDRNYSDEDIQSLLSFFSKFLGRLRELAEQADET